MLTISDICWFLCLQYSVNSFTVRPMRKPKPGYKVEDEMSLTCNGRRNWRNIKIPVIAPGFEYSFFLQPFFNNNATSTETETTEEKSKDDVNPLSNYLHTFRRFAQDTIMDKIDRVKSKIHHLLSVIHNLSRYITGVLN